MKKDQMFEVCDTFARAANIIDGARGSDLSDETPLRELLPGIWPTIGDLRRLRNEMVKLGWKPR
jgi:hypothetical protein